MTFSQALSRIEELLIDSDELRLKLELYHVLTAHADSIVQLAKVAAAMRVVCDYSDPQFKVVTGVYDKLMKGE